MKNKIFKKGFIALCVAAILCTFASCGGKPEESSEAASADASAATSADEPATSVDESATSADDPAPSADESATSVDESAVSTDESATSEATSVDESEGVSSGISEKFKHFQGVSALAEMENLDKGKITMNGTFTLDADIIAELFGSEVDEILDINGSGSLEVKVERFIDNTSDTRKEFIRETQTFGIEIDGKTVSETSVIESLIIGDKEYVFNNDEKTYEVEEAEDPIDFSAIESVETREDVYNGEDCTVDLITFSNGATLEVFTNDGEIISISKDLLEGLETENASFILGLEISHNTEGAIFDIPEGYTEA